MVCQQKILSACLMKFQFFVVVFISVHTHLISVAIKQTATPSLTTCNIFSSPHFHLLEYLKFYYPKSVRTVLCTSWEDKN